MKNDNGNKRKLSKRKDSEAAVSYYEEEGIPKEAVKEYLGSSHYNLLKEYTAKKFTKGSVL